MKVITDERCTGYSHPGHPERPERIAATRQKLRDQKELAISWATPGSVEDASILRAHTQAHLTRLTEPRDFDVDTPFFPEIGAYARASVGAALEALKAA